MKRLSLLLILLLPSVASGQVLLAVAAAPEPGSYTINAAGTTLTIVFDEVVTASGSDNDRLWLNATVGHPTLTYASGSGNATAVLTESLHESTGVTDYNNMTADATSGVLTGQQVFTADQTQTVTVAVE